MGIPLGFVVGFWVFCGLLAFIKVWRFAYYQSGIKCWSDTHIHEEFYRGSVIKLEK